MSLTSIFVSVARLSTIIVLTETWYDSAARSCKRIGCTAQPPTINVNAASARCLFIVGSRNVVIPNDQAHRRRPNYGMTNFTTRLSVVPGRRDTARNNPPPEWLSRPRRMGPRTAVANRSFSIAAGRPPRGPALASRTSTSAGDGRPRRRHSVITSALTKSAGSSRFLRFRVAMYGVLPTQRRAGPSKGSPSCMGSATKPSSRPSGPALRSVSRRTTSSKKRR